MSATGTDRGAGHAAGRAAAPARAVVFGEVLFDHFPDGARVLGGAPFNVAWHLCGFGLDPTLISAVGDDDEGRDILDHMQSWGLGTEGVATHRGLPTGRVVVSLDDAEPSFEIPADQAWDDVPDPGAPDHADLLYHGTLALRAPGAIDRFRALRERLEGPTLVDLNLRAPWWTREIVEAAVAAASWVKASADELAAVTGRPTGTVDECTDAAGRLLRGRPPGTRVVVTRGAEGSILVRQGARPIVAAGGDSSAVVDTVGAGDAFSAVLCHGILSGWDERTTLERAHAFALDICRIRGATSGDLSLYERHLRRWAEPPGGGGSEAGLHVLALSVHGLVRGDDIELGRDADTGGQVSYVVDQARALAAHPAVERVTLVTRLIEDRKVDAAYAVPEEPIAANASIVRLPFGPRRYQRKETLWPHLDALLDELTRWVRAQPRPPDVIHGHYADGGYVGAQLSKLLGVPFVFTGHSLGRVKRDRLLADGLTEETIEERYRISRRIEAEEQALEAADLVIASTRQEVREQFEAYDHYAPERMRVIPPGVDLTRFSPPPPLWQEPPVVRSLARFLVDPDRPLVLAIARLDERKNFSGLIEAYARTPGLREGANLAIVAGTRDDVREMATAPRRVLQEILFLVDAHDLYGTVAYPKYHAPSDVPELYRYAAATKGVFVNAALTEPFGLTLLEAAATGLPVVATDDGGPTDIIEACGHGLLADPLDPDALGKAILEVLSNPERWGRWSKCGVARVHERFAWSSHARAYVDGVRHVLAGTHRVASGRERSRLTDIDRLVVTDIDDTLTGDARAVDTLLRELESAGPRVAFGIATGRSLQSALDALAELGLRPPDVLLTACGTQIRYGRRLVLDRSWERQIRHRWEPGRIRAALDAMPGLRHVADDRTDYRLRYALEGDEAATPASVRARLRQAAVRATVLQDGDRRLDVVPVRASPGLALRFFCFKWNLELSRILVAGDSGNDLDMLEGEMLGVVVANHGPELDPLRGSARVYFAAEPHAAGISEGIRHYDFLGTIDPGDEHRYDH